MRNLLCRRGTTSLCSAGSYVVGDWGSMFRTRMDKQSLSVVSCDIRVQPMTITIEELQSQGRVELYIIWAVPALVIPSCVGTIWNIRMKGNCNPQQRNYEMLMRSSGSHYVFI